MKILKTKFEQEYVRCVRNEEECVCSVCVSFVAISSLVLELLKRCRVWLVVGHPIQFTIKIYRIGFMQVLTIVVEISTFKIFRYLNCSIYNKMG